MSCDLYEYEDIMITFSEMNDDVRCLCTFPHNDNKHLDVSRLRSLAMLGAAVAMKRHGKYADEEYVYLPESLPKWFLKELDRLLPEEK